MDSLYYFWNSAFLYKFGWALDIGVSDYFFYDGFILLSAVGSSVFRLLLTDRLTYKKLGLIIFVVIFRNSTILVMHLLHLQFSRALWTAQVLRKHKRRGGFSFCSFY